MEIDARLLPHALHRALGHVAHGGDLGERESTEEFQVDYLGERWLQFGKLVESIADLAQFAFVYRVIAHVSSEGCDLEKAAALGDLRENAEYKSARDRQEYLQARVGGLRKRLSELALINFESLPHDRIAYGSTVELLDVDKDEKITYKLNPKAVWSDGQPITSTDMKYTWQQIVGGQKISQLFVSMRSSASRHSGMPPSSPE